MKKRVYEVGRGQGSGGWKDFLSQDNRILSDIRNEARR